LAATLFTLKLRASYVAFTNKNGKPARLDVPLENSNNKALSPPVSKTRSDRILLILGEILFLIIVPFL